MASARRGTVWIAPATNHDLPPGRMVDPQTAAFWVSWQFWDDDAQDGEAIEDADVVGADAAIAWGRLRAEQVLIRLGHTHESYFTAGDVPAGLDTRPLPPWPPAGPPTEGWWID
jgi:hypothetical protein